LRFFLIVFLPILVVLAAQPEELMLLIYASDFAEGGTLMPILVVAHGFWAIHAILACADRLRPGACDRFGHGRGHRAGCCDLRPRSPLPWRAWRRRRQ
jgi:hypothetical protein